MWSLSTETTQSTGSLTLFFENKIACHHEWEKEGSHSERITDALDRALKQENISLSAIDRLAVGIGPGSFTGIRVGINFVRALGYALNKPIYTKSSLELLALQHIKLVNPISNVIYVLQYAFRDLFYFQEFLRKDRLVFSVADPIAATIDEIKNSIRAPGYLVGTGAQTLGQAEIEETSSLWIRDLQLSDTVSSRNFLYSAFLDQSLNSFVDWNAVVPLYIRASEAEEKLRRGLLKPS